MKKIRKFIKDNSLSVCVFLLVVSIAILTCFLLNKGYDYYWHIKAGEYMSKNGFLNHDVFSWYGILNNISWISHEWLYEIILYKLSVVFPKYHVIVYCLFFIIILTVSLFLIHRKKLEKNIPFTLIWLTFFILMFSGVIVPRPQLISYVFVVLTLYLLFDLKNNENSKKIFFLPVISCIWANVHGGFSNLPYLLTLIFIFCGFFNFTCDKVEMKKFSKKLLRKYILVFILCIGAVFINPHTYKMFLYPYENMNDTFMMKTIAEWQPTTLTVPYHYLFFMLLIIIVLVLLFSKKKINLIDFMIIGFFSFLGLKSVRFWPLTYLGATFVVFNYIPILKHQSSVKRILLGSVFILVVFISTNIKFLTRRIDTKIISDKAISILKSENPKRLYNIYDYGGYLIYKDIKVFIDGRADMYSKYNYKDNYNLSNLNGSYKKIIKKYNFDYFIVGKDFRIYNYLNDNNMYQAIYKDKKTAIFKTK